MCPPFCHNPIWPQTWHIPNTYTGLDCNISFLESRKFQDGTINWSQVTINWIFHSVWISRLFDPIKPCKLVAFAYWLTTNKMAEGTHFKVSWNLHHLKQTKQDGNRSNYICKTSEYFVSSYEQRLRSCLQKATNKRDVKRKYSACINSTINKRVRVQPIQRTLNWRVGQSELQTTRFSNYL